MNPLPSSRSLLPLFVLLASLFTSIAAQYIYQGCYHVNSTNDPLTLNDTSIYQSQGRCGGQICAPNNYAVFGMTSGQQCYCGNALPSDQAAGENCNVQCPGYPSNICGGPGFMSVYLTGVGTLQGNPAASILPNVTSTATSQPSNTAIVTVGQTTVTQTPSGGGSSSGGISGGAVAGIVIAVLVIAGIAGGAIFYIRRRRKAQYEQYENTGLGSSPGSINRPFGIDQRLEPSMVQRPQSVGSLADDRDYSRKILRVTNPDGND